MGYHTETKAIIHNNKIDKRSDARTQKPMHSQKRIQRHTHAHTQNNTRTHTLNNTHTHTHTDTRIPDTQTNAKQPPPAGTR